jgi:ABC-type Na+ transport system ATPase subunit NatA
VQISSLRKRYPDGRLAVKDLSLCMLEGQITCLLGHNGAGMRYMATQAACTEPQRACDMHTVEQ